MLAASATVLTLSLLAAFPPSLPSPTDDPDKTVEIRREAGKVVFRELGQAKVAPVKMVVGETLRWVNRDDRPHTIRSVVEVDGKRLFTTETIRPGAHKDFLFDIDLYRKAGGRTAQSVELKYEVTEGNDQPGEILLHSPARR